MPFWANVLLSRNQNQGNFFTARHICGLCNITMFFNIGVIPWSHCPSIWPFSRSDRSPDSIVSLRANDLVHRENLRPVVRKQLDCKRGVFFEKWERTPGMALRGWRPGLSTYIKFIHYSIASHKCMNEILVRYFNQNFCCWGSQRISKWITLDTGGV